MLKDFNHMEHLNYICVVADKLNELSREKKRRLTRQELRITKRV